MSIFDILRHCCFCGDEGSSSSSDSSDPSDPSDRSDSESSPGFDTFDFDCSVCSVFPAQWSVAIGDIFIGGSGQTCCNDFESVHLCSLDGPRDNPDDFVTFCGRWKSADRPLYKSGTTSCEFTFSNEPRVAVYAQDATIDPGGPAPTPRVRLVVALTHYANQGFGTAKQVLFFDLYVTDPIGCISSQELTPAGSIGFQPCALRPDATITISPS